MNSKLARYCDAVIEAGWLAALIVIPVFFDVYTSRIFEPDKITMLRTIALVILGAWGLQIWEEGRLSGESALRRRPYLWPVLGLTAVYLLSTVLSITPRISFWGSYQRLQGLYTTLAYLVVFAAVLTHLRRREQVDRLINTVILASLPVSLYGVLQHYGLDPVPWGGDVTTRIAANMGNAIFVAAYLIMAIPLVLVRIVEAFRALLASERAFGVPFVLSTAYIFIGALDLVALFYSGSRGPWLGFLASTFFLALFLSLHFRRRRLMLSIVALAGLIGAFLVTLNIPDGPLEPLRHVPGLGRLGHVFETEGGTGRVRVLIWEGAARLVTRTDPLVYPDGHTDPLAVLRPWIGYGPEGMYVAYNPVYSPELAHYERRNASPDRSHNETWDALVTTGVIGLLVQLTLFTAVFYYGLKWSGFIGSSQWRSRFFGLYLLGGVAGAVSMVAWQGWAFFGVGLPFGLILGLLAYLVLRALFGDFSQYEMGESARLLALIAVLGAIMAHFVEVHFGIAIVATRTYFWTYTALLVVLGENRLMATTVPSVGRSSGAQEKRRRRRSAARATAFVAPRKGWFEALMLALLLGTLGMDYLTNPWQLDRIVPVLVRSLTWLPTKQDAHSPGILLLVVVTWLVGGVLYASLGGETGWWRRFGLIAGTSAVVGSLYWLTIAARLTSLVRAGKAGVLTLEMQVGRLGGLISGYAVFIVFLMLLAGGMREQWAGLRAARRPVALLTAPVLAGVVLWIVLVVHLRPIQADAAFKVLDAYLQGQQWPAAIQLHKIIRRLAPLEDYYYLFEGKTYLSYAQTLQDPNQRDFWLQETERVLLQAQQLNPLNPDHTANLGRLYSIWANMVQDPQQRREKARQSDAMYARVVQLSPNNPTLWIEWGRVLATLLDDPDGALEKFQHAYQLDPVYDQALVALADFYYNQSRRLQGEARVEALQKAASYYQDALRQQKWRNKQVSFGYAVNAGAALAESGAYTDAIAMYTSALEHAPNNPQAWRVSEALVGLYMQLQDYPSAVAAAQKALLLAPDDQKSRLSVLLQQVQSLQQGQNSAP